jgi:hypothetical protein
MSLIVAAAALFGALYAGAVLDRPPGRPDDGVRKLRYSVIPGTDVLTTSSPTP